MYEEQISNLQRELMLLQKQQNLGVLTHEEAAKWMDEAAKKFSASVWGKCHRQSVIFAQM